jgi:pyruvate kinase
MMMAPVDAAEQIEREAVRRAREAGHVRGGDTVVITAGLPLHVPGTTNMIRVLRVD